MDDSISRNAAINALTEENIIAHLDSVYDSELRRFKRATERIIAQLPSTERVGKWIDKGENSAPICSVCKSRALLNYESDYHKSQFCPHCGARMDK